MYLYQESGRYFAQVAEDIKDIAEVELKSLGATETNPVYRGIHFTATPKVLYTINFQSRLLNRVLAPLIHFGCHSDRVLYSKASEVAWDDFLDVAQTFAVFATVSNSVIKHSKFAGLRLKDAIVDAFRAKTGARPSIDPKNPDVWINLYIENNKATISLDTSGGALHRRGYRKKSVDAPMMETVAAAIINLSGWQGDTPLLDPFCGSGTLLCEAYMKAVRMPAGLLRKKFGFESLPDFDAAVWKQVRDEGKEEIKPFEKELIKGSDISDSAITAARVNCAVLNEKNAISVIGRDIFEINKIENQTIICNPPYGIRISQHQDLNNFYKVFGDFLKQRCTGSTAFVYFGDRQYIKSIGLRASWKRPLSNGGLDGRLVKYELY